MAGDAPSTLGDVARTEWRGRPLSLWALMGLLAVLGVRGLVGGGQFVLVPSGAAVGMTPAALAGTPFESYLLPGLVLFSVLGVGPLVALYGLYRGERWGWLGTLFVAAALAVWVIVEGFVVGFGERLQVPNFVQAVVMALLALIPSVRERYG